MVRRWPGREPGEDGGGAGVSAAGGAVRVLVRVEPVEELKRPVDPEDVIKRAYVLGLLGAEAERSPSTPIIRLP